MFAVSLLLVAAGAFADSVTINNPADTENVIAGTVWVDATASDTSTPIWVIQIYLDGTKATEKVVNNVLSCSIDASVTMSAGTHTLTVQTLTNAGALIARSTIHPNAVTASTTINFIDDLKSNWIACNQCGGGGGGDPVPVTIVGSPSEDGTATQFTTFGETNIKGPYATSYWYAPHTAPSAKVSYIKLAFDLYVPAAYVNTPQAIEFECQQDFSGLTYNFGWQAQYKGTTNNLWRIFDYAGGTGWNYSGIPLTRFSGDTWHHIIAEYHVVNGTNQIYHDSLTIDGTRLVPTQNFIHNAKNTGAGNQLTNAFQLDMDSANDAYTVYVDGMSVQYTTY